jgi:5-methyltetrahydrofolate corrinoid/iron sulfur protein methyltransferase
MLIIGEKLNGTLKKTAAAIAARDVTFVQDMAKRQVDAGADYLDVNAGTGTGDERLDLVWLVETVQAVVDVPLCLDSADPVAMKTAMECVHQTPMVNSISGEAGRMDAMLPLVAQQGSPVIALLLDDGGIPADVPGRVAVGRRILEQARQAGVPDEKVYIDPLALTISTNTEGANIAIQSMRLLRQEFPQVKFSLGLSNISFGLPARSLVNQAFLAQALAAGLDAAIINPLEQGIMNMLYATELILGRDRYCRRYTSAFRAGKIKLESQP